MPLTRRRLVSVACSMSLLFCVAIVPQWVRSYRYSQSVYWMEHYRGGKRSISARIMISAGCLSAQVFRWDTADRWLADGQRVGLHLDEDLPWRNPKSFLGFGCGRSVVFPRTYGFRVDVPLWAFAVPAVLWAVLANRRRRRQKCPGFPVEPPRA